MEITSKYDLELIKEALQEKLVNSTDEGVDGQIDRWLVENSHGDDECYLGKGHNTSPKGKGYVSMTDQWFQKYVYQVVSLLEYLPENLQDKLRKPAVEIEPWGIIGCELLKVYGN